jgi:thiol-disulfide isomerase/thioredoxin
MDLTLTTFYCSYIQGQATVESKFFIIFPIIGLLFSIIALKDLFGTKSEIITNFCNISASTSCSTVVNSDKWKIFKHINFSDLSIIFFATQFLGIFTFLISGDVSSFLHIQEILLLCSIPIVLASLYFQKIVEKKWCPICLVIIGLVLCENIYLFQIISFSIDVPIKSITSFLLVFLLVSFVWSILKVILTEQKELKEFRFKGYRFMRNYEIFKNLLLTEDKIELSHSPIVLGNKESRIEISFITNPFCGHCKDAHKILDKILSQNRDNIKIKVLINADFENMDEDRKILFRSLMSLYLEKGEDLFLEALKNWFDNPNLQEWMDVYQSNSNHEEIDLLYQLQNQWCIDNNSFQTPSIFINGYRYPKNYDRENLEFFVNELVEDEI